MKSKKYEEALEMYFRETLNEWIEPDHRNTPEALYKFTLDHMQKHKAMMQEYKSAPLTIKGELLNYNLTQMRVKGKILADMLEEITINALI